MRLASAAVSTGDVIRQRQALFDDLFALASKGL